MPRRQEVATTEGRALKVLVLNGSPRKNGVAAFLAGEAASLLGERHDVEVYNVYDLEVRPCIGCLRCRPDKACVLERDGGHVIGEKLKESDLIVIGSPTYWGNIPGPLKTLFDRNVTLFEYVESRPWSIPKKRLKGKKAILIVSSASPYPYNLLPSQSKGAIRALKTVLGAGGIRIEGIVNVPNAYAFETRKEKYVEKVRRVVRPFL